MAAVPRVLNRLHDKIVQGMLAAGGLKTKLFVKACEAKVGRGKGRGIVVALSDLTKAAALFCACPTKGITGLRISPGIMQFIVFDPAVCSFPRVVPPGCGSIFRCRTIL